MFKTKRIDVGTTDTLIGESSVFEGNIKSEAGLRIEGQLVGDIECSGDVTIGEGGRAKSNMTARNVIIAGTVTGNVTTKGTFTLMATGRFYGNIQAGALIIAEGAVFEGTSRMDATSAEKSASPSTVKPSSSGKTISEPA